ncbi:hypothetical protein ACFL3G_12345 [Planctomycetota bacterium]
MARNLVQTKNYKYKAPFFNNGSTPMSRVETYILHKKAGVEYKMLEHTKISFNHRKDISDYSDLVEMLFPANRNQQHAAMCILFELKWTDLLMPNMAHLETKHSISRRILQRTRAKLSKLGLIEHVSYLNSRYDGQHGWKLSTRFERALNLLAQKYTGFRDTKTSSKEKDSMLVDFANAKRNTANPGKFEDTRGETV